MAKIDGKSRLSSAPAGFLVPTIILASAAIPLMVRSILFGMPVVDDASQIVGTAIGVSISVVIGFLVSEEALRFPGRMLVGYVFTTFSAAFMFIVALFFMFRFDYSRFQFLGGYVVATGTMVLYYWRAHARPKLTLALVPFGDAQESAAQADANWIVIDAPGSIPSECQCVVADLRSDLPERWVRFITACVLQGVPVFHSKQIVEILTGKLEIRHLSENTLGSLNPTDIYLRFKYFVDATAATILLAITWPLFLIVAALVRLDSPGPALFRQERVGFRGERFRIYKFRTMTHEPAAAQDDREASMTVKDDQRITRVGAVLRKTRLDELPQVFNIIRGEMSWIGPRPEAVPLSEWYESSLPFYSYRHIVRPGITGWAQVNQGHVVELDDVLEKLHYDFFYIKRFSPWLDMLISLMTLEVMIRGHGAR